jgi:hypothetical protein
MTMAKSALFSLPNHFSCQLSVRTISPQYVVMPRRRSALPTAHLGLEHGPLHRVKGGGVHTAF